MSTPTTKLAPCYVPLQTAAEYAGLAADTLRQYIRDGKLPGYQLDSEKHGRLFVKLSDVDAFYAARRAEARAEAAARKESARQVRIDICRERLASLTHPGLREPYERELSRLTDEAAEQTEAA